MPDYSQIILNKRIVGFNVIDDYAQLRFADGSVLTIYNNYQILNAPALNMAGQTIVAVETHAESISLYLDVGEIRVGMQDSDYVGPEAMCYMGEDGHPIVWRGEV